MHSLNSIPRSALLLGLGGLIPFYASLLGIALFDEPSSLVSTARLSLLVYGAVILSFLGGIRWGVTLSDISSGDLQWHPLVLSVLPSVAGWIALLLPYHIALLVLLSGFAGQYLIDRTGVKAGILPPWFGNLRLLLTTGVIAALLIALPL